MNVLLDEMMPKKLRPELVGHTAKTIAQARWKGIVNGKLLRLAEQDFDAFLTMDGGLTSQQKIEDFDLGFLIVHAIDNQLETLLPLVPEMLKALNHVRPGTVVHVPAHYVQKMKRRRGRS